ncbi:MAG: FkbM family methyltransferase [Bacteroidia bacterium]
MLKIFQTPFQKNNPFQKIGLEGSELKRIKTLPSKKYSASKIFGNLISFPDGYWFLYSLKEIFIDEVYKFKTTSKAPVIIDCGANIGLSVIYFKKLFPDAKVVAFEPDHKIFEMFKKNMQPYNFNDVELINKAVWTSDSELTFLAEGTLGGKINLEPSTVDKNIIKVKSVRLKDFLNTKIDFLKIDIEGAEYEVLLDCKEELKNVAILFFEYHGSKNKQQQILHEILKVVTDAGFQYYIKESFPVVQFPFIEKASEKYYDLMLNVFCYRV